LREEELFYSRLNPNPLGQLTPPGVASGYMISGDEGPHEAEMVGTQELFFVALGLVCTIISWIKLRPAYAVWMTGSWILCASVNFFRSMPRYTLMMFPIFILFALLGRNRFWAGVLTAWSLLFFALFAVLFAHGEWAF